MQSEVRKELWNEMIMLQKKIKESKEGGDSGSSNEMQHCSGGEVLIENIMFSTGLCSHFALGTLLETWLKEPLFRPTYPTSKNPKVSNLRPEPRIVSTWDIILHSLIHFDIFQHTFSAVVMCI